MVNAKRVLYSAMKNKYAVASLNICNLETFQAIVNASIKTNVAVFMNTSNKTIVYAGLNNILALYNALPKSSKVILHLDHGDYKNTRKCIRNGYPSVMFDGSKLKLKSNIKKTAKIVAYAHENNVVVEGEVGALDGEELTNVEDAKEFVKETGVDTLAISIGTMHGYYKYMPVLDFKRLIAIRKAIKIPLVLHGASGLRDEDIKLSIKYGINKINIDTALRWKYTKSVEKTLREDSPSRLNKKSFDIRNYSSKGKNAFENKAIKYIKLFQK